MAAQARTSAPPPAVVVHLRSPAHPAAAAPDLPRLARAVERLVHSLAPDVVTRVTIAPAELADLGDGLTLDTAGRRLAADGRQHPLTRREFELLHHLHRRAGVALSRRELMTQVWGHEQGSGDRTIDVHVRRLRVKLGRHADRITTLRGYGYRFD